MNNKSLERLKLVHPLLMARVLNLNIAIEAAGEHIEVTEGLRSYSRQEALYAQGRTEPGPIVTKAPGGYSWHNYGLAVDVAPFVEYVPEWDLSNPTWQRIADLAPSNGLFSGSQFIHMVDWPHLQLAEIPHSPTAEHRQIFKAGGIESVWKELGLEA